MTNEGIRMSSPTSPEEWREAQALVREYVEGLGVDLSFQQVDDEVERLSTVYAPPQAAFVWVHVDGALAGGGAWLPRPDADHPNACEMRRLYVRRAFRRFGLGRLLAQALMDSALQAGFSCMLLDTLDDMEAARGLYDSLGFEDIPPFYFNPLPGAHYLKVML